MDKENVICMNYRPLLGLAKELSPVFLQQNEWQPESTMLSENKKSYNDYLLPI